MHNIRVWVYLILLLGMQSCDVSGERSSSPDDINFSSQSTLKLGAPEVLRSARSVDVNILNVEVKLIYSASGRDYELVQTAGPTDGNSSDAYWQLGIDVPSNTPFVLSMTWYEQGTPRFDLIRITREFGGFSSNGRVEFVYAFSPIAEYSNEDGAPDYAGFDIDGNGITNLEERLEGFSDPVAGCPGLDNPDPTNTDGDLLFDVCDPDDDGDGFNDVDDPAPLDPSIPGDFSTPESILSDNAVSTALQEAAAAGFPIATAEGLNPPDLTGYYIRGDLVGSLPVNSSTFGMGSLWVGAESRTVQSNDNTINSASVSFTASMPISFGISEGTIIRGEGNSFTRYSRGKGVCTEGNSNFETFSVSIASGTVDPATGNIENYRSISTTVDTAGELTTVCAERLNGLTEIVGNWAVAEVAVIEKILPAQMTYMCVSDDEAYVPTETWTNSDGLSCSCTLDYEMVCE